MKNTWGKLLATATLSLGGMMLAVPLAGATTLHAVSAKTAVVHKTVKKGTKKTKTKTTTIHVAVPPALEVEHSKYGLVLQTGEGRTLYETTGKCVVTKCQGVWPPLVIVSKPHYGKGVNTKLVKEVKIKSGLEQLSYGGHLLYEFVGDTKAHQYHGEGLNTPFGRWDVVSAANGKPVMPKVTKKAKTVAKTTKAKTVAKTTTGKKW